MLVGNLFSLSTFIALICVSLTTTVTDSHISYGHFTECCAIL